MAARSCQRQLNRILRQNQVFVTACTLRSHRHVSAIEIIRSRINPSLEPNLRLGHFQGNIDEKCVLATPQELNSMKTLFTIYQ